jgi:AbrB family looped-hinge helix DNA binding protein
MRISKLDKKNNIKIPAEVKNRLGIRNGDYVFFDIDEEGRIYICPTRQSEVYQVQKTPTTNNVVSIFREFKNKELGENITDR